MRRCCLMFLLLCLLTGCSSKNKEELYALGMQKVGEGAHDAAAVYFKNALEKDANYVDARQQLAKSYQALGKFEQAEKEYQKILNQDPSRHAVHLDLARVLNSRKKPDDALKEVEIYLKANPGNLDGIEVQGVAYSLQKNFAAAEQALLQVVQADPKKSQPKLELAAVYLNQKREQDGRRLLDEVVAAEPKNTRPLYMLASLEASQGKIDRALEVYNRIMAVDPKDAQAVYKVGAIYIGKGDVTKAEALADDLIKRMPKKGEGYRLKGLVQYQQKKYPDAIATLQNSVKISPNVEGHYYLGLSLFHKGELENALSQFRKIIDVAPTFTNARLLTSLILLNQKRVDDAITEIRKVLEQNDQNALAHNVYGSALIAKGQYDEGMKELNRATALDPKIVDAHLKKGIFKLSRGRVAEAETDLSAAVQVAPDLLNSRLLLASFQMRQGKAAKAREVLKAGLKGGKEDAVIYNSLAGIAFADKKKEEAVGYLAKAKEVDPLFGAAYYNLAAYHASQGNADAARSEYQALLQKSPKDVRAMLGMAVLAEIGGKEADALNYYTKANETKELAGITALAGYHVKRKEGNKAVKVLNEGLKVLPRNVQLLEMKGRLLVTDKKFTEAVKVFDDIEQESKGRGIVLKIGAHVAAKDFDRAEEQARRIIALQPNSAAGYLVLASVFESQKNLPRALEEVRSGLKVDATNLEALLKLGNLYLASRDTTRAMSTYGEALKIKQDFIPAIFAQGALLESTGNKKEAVKKYREVLARDNNYVPAMNNLAFLYADGFGPKEEALRLAIGAYRLEPANAAILDTVGYALLINGKQQDALKVLQKAAEVIGQNPSVQYHLALAHRANNQKREAQQALQKALASGEFPERAVAQKLNGELR